EEAVIGPTTLIMKYGSFAVAGVVCLESMGLPLPGEAILVAAAIYAGKTGDLNIVEVIAAAAGGAMVGDNIGYWIGREIGFRLLVRYGSHVGPQRGAHQSRTIFIPKTWRQDCLLRALRRAAQGFGGAPR